MLIEIIFRDPRGTVVYDCVVPPYEKGSYTCFTVKERNPATGNHRIFDYPTEIIWRIGRDHLPHMGTSLTQGKKAK
jgi:hypothetical protein